VVYTNRCPSTAMRGFGVTAVDFALEVQMDKLAHAVGMDPMEFRILNAYRDGDMKPHRRVAKNTALIECVQVAAERAGWPLSPEAKRQSSVTGGGEERALIPATPIDERGLIGRPDSRDAPSHQSLPAGHDPHPAQQGAGGGGRARWPGRPGLGAALRQRPARARISAGPRSPAPSHVPPAAPAYGPGAHMRPRRRHAPRLAPPAPPPAAPATTPRHRRRPSTGRPVSPLSWRAEALAWPGTRAGDGLRQLPDRQ
jgi:hypothetical protein